MYYYHLTHIDNIPQIIRYGLLSHSLIKSRGYIHKDLSNHNVQDKRNKTFAPWKKKYKLKDFVPLFHRTKTPMAYTLKDDQIVFLRFKSSDILKHSESTKKLVIYTDGNAASDKTKFYIRKQEAFFNLPDIANENEKCFKYWNDWKDGKRIFSAEILVHKEIPTRLINCIMFKDIPTEMKIRKLKIDVAIGTCSRIFF